MISDRHSDVTVINLQKLQTSIDFLRLLASNRVYVQQAACGRLRASVLAN